MSYIRNILFFIAMLLLAANCSKKDANGSTTLVSFSLPQNFSNTALKGSACFAVSITADDISGSSAGDCDPAYGIFGGLAPMGGAIELEAKFGSNRTIDIFYVMSDQGCQAIDPSQGLGQQFGANKVFRISQTKGVNFDKPQVVVEAQIDWPRSNNTLRSLYGLPASCDKGDDPLLLTAVKQARVVLGNYRGTTSQGSKVHVRLLDQKLSLKNPTNFSGRLAPVRLGVKND